MSRSAFCVPDHKTARTIIEAAPAAGMFAKPEVGSDLPVVVIDHDESYGDKVERFVRSFVPTAERLPEPAAR